MLQYPEGLVNLRIELTKGIESNSIGRTLTLFIGGFTVGEGPGDGRAPVGLKP